MSREEIIGDCSLILGDCLDVLPMVGAQCIVTSPPYGAIRDYGGHPAPDLLAVIDECAGVIKPGGVLVWNVADQTVDGSETGDSFRQALHAMECGLRLHDTMIYCKEGVTFPGSNRYHPAFEYMFVFSRGAPAHFNPIKDWPNKWRGTPPHGTKRLPNGETMRTDVIGFGAPEPIADFGLRRNWWPTHNVTKGFPAGDHPAPMPYSMAFDHVYTWTVEGETVVDPFMGSGTTGVACVNLGRKFTGIEIEPKYFEIACKRIEEAYRQPRLFAEPTPKMKQETLL